MDRPLLARRLRHAGLDIALSAADFVVGRRSVKLRAAFRYLRGLIADGRHAEVDALLAHALRKLLRRPPVRRRRRGDLTIDARTERLDAAGRIAPLAAPHVERPGAPLASIVIPCFNYGRFVREAVASGRAQTLVATEVIVVDDGSTDADTVNVLDAIAASGEVILLRQANAGLPAARNAGIARAGGRFIVCLDADDVLDPTYLETTIALLEADLSAGFAYSHVRFFGDVDEVWETRAFDPEEALLGNFTAVSATFRRADWAAVGGYATEMRGGFEDWEFWIRLACLGRTGRVARVPLFGHRRHGRTMTHEAKDMREELQARMRRLDAAFFEDAGLRRRIARLAPRPRPVEEAFGLLGRADAIGRDTRSGLLVVVPWLRAGGAERLLATVLRGLANEFRIVVATTEIDSHALADVFRAITPELFHLAEIFDAPDERTAFLVHLGRSRDATRVLTSSSTEAIAALPALKAAIPGLKTANLLHNDVADSVFRAAAAASDMIDSHIVVARRIRAALEDLGVAPDRIAHVPSGIAPPACDDGAVNRLDLGEADAPLLVWIGRLATEKRPVAFVDILARIAAGSPVRGIIVGDGPERPAVEAAIARHGLGSRIRLTGQLQPAALAEVYAAANALVLTSEVEGMPLVVLEALACGLPVAATDVGDIADLLAGKPYGLLVAPDRVQDLAGAIAAALPTWSQIGRAAIMADFAAGPHNEGAMVEAYRKVLG